jgi:hypothetical protein
MSAMVAASAASAKQLTADEAIARFSDANNAPLAAKAMKGNASRASFVVENTVRTADNAEALYLCRKGDRMVVLPADDRAMPVLGYFDTPANEELPTPVQRWLDEYARQIAYLRTLPEQSCKAKARTEDYAAIEPLVKTQWSEYEPYNAMMPILEDGSQSYVGSVGISYAAVMRYFKYPQQATGSISYVESGFTRQMDFTEQPFDWDNMLDNYSGDYTTTQLNAMAYLVKACTYAAKAKFEEYCSSYDEIPLEALAKNFGYSDKARMLFRDFMSYDEWEALVYNNLKTVGPLVYGGEDTVYGFGFVLDGYDKDGFFHINWGLGGIRNGYFQLDAIHEYGTDEHGAINGYGYSFNQEGIFNITPAGNETIELPDMCPIIWIGNVIATLTGTNTVSLTSDVSADYSEALYSNHYSAEEFELTLKARKADDINAAATTLSDAATQQYTVGLIGWGEGLSDVTINFKSGTGLAAGTYTLTPVVRIKGSDRWEEISHNNASTLNFTAQIDDNGNIVQVTSTPIKFPAAKNITLEASNFALGSSIKYTFDLVNSLDADVTSALIPQIFVYDKTSGEPLIIEEGEVVVDETRANESKHLTYVSDMYLTDETYANYSGAAYFALRNNFNGTLSELISVNINEVDGVAAISAQNAISIVSNRTNGTVSITAPSAIAAIEGCSITGSAVNLHAAINGTTATATLPNGFTIVKVTLANGDTAIAKLTK